MVSLILFLFVALGRARVGHLLGDLPWVTGQWEVSSELIDQKLLLRGKAVGMHLPKQRPEVFPPFGLVPLKSIGVNLLLPQIRFKRHSYSFVSFHKYRQRTVGVFFTR